MSANLSAIFYLVSGVLFILALRGLSSPETSRQGNFFGILGMVIAITVTFLSVGNFSSGLIYVLIFLLVGGLIGAFIAYKIPMTAMPELVAGFHSLVGLSAVFVAISAFLNPEAFNLGSVGAIKLASLIEMSIGAAVGAITFSGSIIAFLKLQGIMSGSPITFKGQHFLNALLLISIIILTYLLCSSQSSNFFWILIAVSFLIGFLLIIPIGGADMPVVISMLNSYSGWAAAGIGFTLENTALIITGPLVGSSGAILSYIMCKGMNRSFFNVILGGFGATEQSASTGNKEQRPVKSGNAEDAAFLMKNASSVIIVPGYGMAVARAQNSLKEMVDKLKEMGINDEIIQKIITTNSDYTYNPTNLDANFYDRTKAKSQDKERFAYITVKQMETKGLSTDQITGVEHELEYARGSNIDPDETSIAYQICKLKTYSDITDLNKRVGNLQNWVNSSITDDWYGSDYKERDKIVGCLNTASNNSRKGDIAAIADDKITIIL